VSRRTHLRRLGPWQPARAVGRKARGRPREHGQRCRQEGAHRRSRLRLGRCACP
jgi:hypothetical protein